METIEATFREFQKLPDWERFPLPEVIYKQFNIKKPQPASINELAGYQPPAHLPIGDPQMETRPPAEGGVRKIEELPPLPVQTEIKPDPPFRTLLTEMGNDPEGKLDKLDKNETITLTN